MVVHIITRLAMGGAQQLVYEITSRMHNSTNNVVIFTGLSDKKKSLSAQDNKILDDVYNDSIPVEVIPSLTDRISLIRDLKSLIAIYKLLKIYKPSSVHIHSSKTGILGRIACKLLNINQIIYHVHGWSFSRSTGYSHKFYLFLEKLLYNYTTDYIFVCKQDMIDYINLGGNPQITTKSHIIYPGAYFLEPNKMEQARNELRRTLGLNERDHVIGTIARLDFQKNPQIFVEIASKYIELDNDAKFLWIGKGALLNLVKKQIDKLGLTDKFILPGYIDDVRPYFAIFDTFIITSRYEGLPVTLLKALACGTPVVGFKINGIIDLSDEFKSVLGVNKNSVDDFVKSLVDAKAMKKTRHDVIINEANFVMEYYNIEAMYSKIIKIYN